MTDAATKTEDSHIKGALHRDNHMVNHLFNHMVSQKPFLGDLSAKFN